MLNNLAAGARYARCLPKNVVVVQIVEDVVVEDVNQE